MILRARFSVAAAVAIASFAGAEVPEQFRVWGGRAAPHPYLADPGPLPAVRTGLEATPAELSCGLVVFARPVFDPPPAGFVPAMADRCTGIEAADCPGQYGPMSFGVLALRGTTLSITVTGLKGPRGARIGSENLDVRVARYFRVPEKNGSAVIPLLLESSGREDIQPGRFALVWVTYHVPAASAPGPYEGEVRLAADGKVRARLPLRLTVLPFRLVEPGLNLYMYSQDPGDPAVTAREYADMRLHGMTTAWVHTPVTSDGELSRSAEGAAVDAFRKAGFPRRLFLTDLANRVTCRWLNVPDKAIGMWGPWMRYLPVSDSLDRRFSRLVGLIRDESRARGLTPIIEVGDEAGSHPWTIPAISHYLGIMKRDFPDLPRELTVGGGWASGRPEDELWHGLLDIWTTNRWLAEKIALVRSREPKAAFQAYNMGGAGSAPGGLTAARHLFGFFAWKVEAAGAAQWVYFHDGTPEHNYAWPAVGGGFVPTLRWEAVREGAKDARYLATLWSSIAGRTDARADEARGFLGELADQIQTDSEEYDRVSGGSIRAPRPNRPDRWRARMAELMEAR